MTSGARLDTNWRFRGFQVLTLENVLLRVDVIPELGGKIYNFIYKPFDRNFLWHNPRIELRKVPLGANYNDNYAGGWDELFPNDAAVEFQGESLPDHGELWCQTWDYEVSQARLGAGFHPALALRERYTDCDGEEYNVTA